MSAKDTRGHAVVKGWCTAYTIYIYNDKNHLVGTHSSSAFTSLGAQREAKRLLNEYRKRDFPYDLDARPTWHVR